MFRKLIELKDKINQQISPVNHEESIEFLPHYYHLNEVEITEYKKELAQKCLANSRYIAKCEQQHKFYNDLNDAFKAFLIANEIKEPKDANEEQRQLFKEQEQDKIPIHEKNSLDNPASLIDSLVNRLFQNETLAIEDTDLAQHFQQGEWIKSKRKEVYKQFYTKDLAWSKLDLATRRKNYALLSAPYWESIKPSAGYCDEYAYVALFKIANEFATEIQENKLSVEFAVVTILGHRVAVYDTHCFILLNRDLQSNLNNIQSWGSSAIIFDPWNKLVCYAAELNTLPHAYRFFIFPENNKWESFHFQPEDLAPLCKEKPIESISAKGNILFFKPILVETHLNPDKMSSQHRLAC